MYDTLILNMADFSISKNAKIKIKQGSIDYETNESIGMFLLYQDTYNSDNNVWGSSAHYNDPNDRFYFDLLYKRGFSIPLVRLSIPKTYNGNNFHSPGRQGSKATLIKLEKMLKEIGLGCNILQSNLSRVDIFKNIETAEPFSVYGKILSDISVSRKELRDYGTTFLHYNKQEEICIYDKISEMKSKNLSVENLPKNVMRFENRLLKPSKIKSSLGGISKAIELFDNYDYVKQFFINNMEKSIFKYSTNEVLIKSTKQIEQELLYFMTREGDRGFDKFKKARGLISLTNEVGEQPLLDVYEKAMISCNKSQDAIYKALQRVRKDIRESKKELMFASSNYEVKDKTVVNLYDELKRKVLAVA